MKSINMFRIYKKYKMVALAFFCLIITCMITNKPNTVIEKEQQQMDEIILLLERSMSGEELGDILNNLDLSLEIKVQIDDYVLLQVKQEDMEKALDVLAHQEQVKLAEQNGMIETLKNSEDLYFGAQWGLHNSGEYLSFENINHMKRKSVEDVDMDAPEGWNALSETTYTKEVVVAILDTGVDYTHEDIVDQMWINPGEIPGDGIDNDENGYVDDIHGWDFYNNDATIGHFIKGEKESYLADPKDNDNHGTHIAGIIGAKAQNGLGIAGVASNVNVKLMALKVNGGAKGSGTISSAIEGIKYATQMGADICNLSWGTSQNSLALEQVMRESDLLFVTAAGNTGADNDKVPIYPANYQLDNMIVVTFIDAYGNLTRKSNYSPKRVDVAAPGDDIFSTIVGSYGYMSGSSMATPHVTGVAAILYATQDNVFPSNIKKVLLSSLKPLKSLEGKIKYEGIPSIDLLAENKSKVITDVKVPKVSLSTVYHKDKMIVKVTGKDTGKSGIRVIKWLTGKRTVEDFNRGMNGFSLENDEISVTKAGNYTVYISDYAGNEAIKVYKVKADVSGPLIDAYYRVSKTYKTRTISIQVKDAQSGVKRVKYMSGNRKAEEFLPAGAGTDVEITKGKGEFTVKKDGTYTIFASDYRGNLSVFTIKVKTVKATEVKFVRLYKNMAVGDTYMLNAFVRPSNTTDTLSYVSSDKNVATVSKTGKVKAVGTGYSYVVVTTASGKSAVCKIIVK